MAIAECTDLPLVLSSWQARQVEGSAFGSSGTGCCTAETRPAHRKTKKKHPKALIVQRRFGLDLKDSRATPTYLRKQCFCTNLAFILSACGLLKAFIRPFNRVSWPSMWHRPMRRVV